MDKNINPFSPGAGVSPPELAGRSEVLESAETALERTKRGRHAKSLMILGLRGVGKTVLLNQIKELAVSLDDVIFSTFEQAGGIDGIVQLQDDP